MTVDYVITNFPRDIILEKVKWFIGISPYLVSADHNRWNTSLAHPFFSLIPPNCVYRRRKMFEQGKKTSMIWFEIVKTPSMFVNMKFEECRRLLHLAKPIILTKLLISPSYCVVWSTSLTLFLYFFVFDKICDFFFMPTPTRIIWLEMCFENWYGIIQTKRKKNPESVLRQDWRGLKITFLFFFLPRRESWTRPNKQPCPINSSQGLPPNT